MGNQILSPLSVLAEELRYWLSFVYWRSSGSFKQPPPILVVGAPKTGTTWTCSLLSDLPGVSHRGHHESAKSIAGMTSGDLFHSHARAKESLIAAVEESGAKPILVIRDLRDQAVSRAFHISREQFTADHRSVSGLRISELLRASIIGWPTYDFYGVVSSAKFAQEWKSTGLALSVRYEDLLKDSSRMLEQMCGWLGLQVPLKLLRLIASRNRFERASAGKRIWKTRTNGHEDQASFFRKGIVGDWRNYFTEEHVSLVKELVGDELVSLGYESNQSWAL